jgi:hypothetical protein
MKITKISILTRKYNTMDLPVTVEQMDRYDAGEHVQVVFPELSVMQREFLVSGMSEAEQILVWDKPKEAVK